MNFLELISVAISLSLDAFAIAVCQGMNYNLKSLKDTIKISGFFGFFQSLMPVLGFSLCNHFNKMIAFNKIISFILLSFIGGKMIYDALHTDHDVCPISPKNSLILSIPSLLFLSVATSLDAFAVGVTLSVLQNDIMQPVIIIGIITFVISLIGVHWGKNLHTVLRNKSGTIGGIVLILIGIKLLF